MNKIKMFGSMCKLTQSELKQYVNNKLVAAGYTTQSKNGFVYAKGDIPILLTAHLDTVHKETVQRYSIHNFKGKHLIKSPQGIGGDDRCGVYMILDIIQKYKPYVLFCEDEEIGGIGSNTFCNTSLIDDIADNVKYMIELDRANAKDAVFYDCDNKEFTKYITEKTGYAEAYGTFSDISNLMPETYVAGVNLSCGYYNAHTLKEYVLFEEMENTIEVVKKLLDDADTASKYKFVQKKYAFSKLYGRYYDDGYSYGGFGYGGYGYGYANGHDSNAGYEYSGILQVSYVIDGVEYLECGYGETEEEAFGNFFIEHPDVCYNDVFDFVFL